MDAGSNCAHNKADDGNPHGPMIAAPPPAILEVYYAPSCAPCRMELPVLAEVRRRDGAKLRIVIVSDDQKARDTLRAVSPSLAQAAHSPQFADARASLRAAGDPDGILPYARSLSSTGRTCAQWRGGLTLGRVRALVAACARVISGPYPRRF
jgi:thiol-disulfide isomerase/thioredoxin